MPTGVPKQRKTPVRIQDAVGTGLSGLCLMHCLALPVLISLSPVFAWFEHEWIHGVLAVLALAVLLNAMRAWPDTLVGAAMRLAGMVGVGLLFAGWLVETSEIGERIVTSVGAVMLAGAHISAWSASRSDHLHANL